MVKGIEGEQKSSTYLYDRKLKIVQLHIRQEKLLLIKVRVHDINHFFGLWHIGPPPKIVFNDGGDNGKFWPWQSPPNNPHDRQEHYVQTEGHKKGLKQGGLILKPSGYSVN